MGSGGNGGTHDKPGTYKVIPTGTDIDAFQALLDDAEAAGYEKFVALNDAVAVLYKKNGH